MHVQVSKMDEGMTLQLTKVGLKADKTDLDELQQKLRINQYSLSRSEGEGQYSRNARIKTQKTN